MSSFSSRYHRRPRRQDTWKGLAAGLVGGLVASWVMNQFQSVWEQASEALQPEKAKAAQQKQSQRTQKSKKDDEDATMKAAGKISEIAGKPLTKDQKKKAGPIVHYAFGSAMGALYGAAVEWFPEARKGNGMAFGSAVFAAADEIGVPAFGLSPPPTEFPLSTHVYGVVSHSVYGVTTEVVRSTTRKLLNGRRRAA